MSTNRLRWRFLVFTACIAAIAVPAFAQNGAWPNYGYDTMHRSQNPDAEGYAPSGFRPVWVFPRSGSGLAGPEIVIDNVNQHLQPNPRDPNWIIDTVFTASGAYSAVFTTDPNDANFFQDPTDYYGTEVIGRDPAFYVANASSSVSATFTWQIRDSKWTSGKRPYFVYAWFPSSASGMNDRKNTVAAVYKIFPNINDLTIYYGFTVNQTRGGGWVLLNTQVLELEPNFAIVLENKTSDYNTPKGIVVAADAIKLVPATGMEIYSSPIAGEAKVDPQNSTADVPVVYTATIETAAQYGAITTNDLGAVYCVYSYTSDALNARALDYIGLHAWRYPRHTRSAARSEFEMQRAARDISEIEGPIAGGIFSTPVLAGDRLIFAGMDRQVYCVSAVERTVGGNTIYPGELLWKGPGRTVSEPTSRTDWVVIGDPDVPDGGRADAFGHRFLQARIGLGNPADIVWNSSKMPDGAPSKDLPEGMYSVYVWLPDKAWDEGADPPGWERRASSVKYEITNLHGDVYSVYVDQNDSRNVGAWVKLGDKFWTPRSVRLVMDPNETKPAGGGDIVVADAVMFIPAELEAFSYSSPVVPRDSTGNVGDKVYIGNINGRLYCLDINDGEIEWVFPHVQTVENPSKPDEDAAPPLGAIVSSPALPLGLNPQYVYISSMNGRVYKLRTTGDDANRVKWMYPAADESVPPGRVFDSSPMLYGGHVIIGGSDGRLYGIDDSTGKIYRDTAKNEEAGWVLPKSSSIKDGDPDEAPLGAFHFATPAFESLRNYLIIGSTDGYVYAFDLSDPANPKPAWGSVQATDYRGTGRNMFSPIKACVGLDSQPSGEQDLQPNAYVATMGGNVYWLATHTGLFREYRNIFDPSDPLNGQTGYSIPGAEAFASPAAAYSYTYFAWSSGQLIAFSWRGTGAWGNLEDWELPGYDVPGGATVTKPDPTGSKPEIDIFQYPSSSSKISAEDTIAFITEILSKPRGGKNAYRLAKDETISPAPGKSSAGFFEPARSGLRDHDLGVAQREKPHADAWRVATTEKDQLFLEWGEKVYLIAWNLNALSDLSGGSDSPDSNGNWSDEDIQQKRRSVRFTFTSSTPGPNSGQISDTLTAAYLAEYEQNDSTTTAPKFRSVAVCEVTIGSSRRNPPSPGYGWQFSVNVSLRRGSTQQQTQAQQPRTSMTIPGSVPELEGGKPKKDSNGEQIPLRIGINNPLAIRDDQPTPRDLAWPSVGSGGLLTTNRMDPEAHFNGNGGMIIDPTTGEITTAWQQIDILMDMGYTNHGTNSRIAFLGVMDRSAMGLSGREIENFRIEAHDISWTGGNKAVSDSGGVILPWEWPPVDSWGGRWQRDYPDISVRRLGMRKGIDDKDPSQFDSELPPCVRNSDPKLGDYDHAFLVPEVVKTIVDVPRFQPANVGTSMVPGYEAYFVAYLDSEGGTRGKFDNGNIIAGRPTTIIEPHRFFRLGVRVPPDLRIQVEESTVDLGKGPHGLGEQIPRFLPFWADPAFDGNPATADPPREPLVAQWFKPITVKNIGNTNLARLTITRPDLLNDRNPFARISGGYLISSFDDPNYNVEPFVTDRDPNDRFFGHTLAKARVGDPDPTELRIPDLKKPVQWDALLKDEPPVVRPLVSCIAPVGTPIGSYGAYVNVFADLNGNRTPDIGREPISTPFLVKLQVRESQLTDGVTAGSLPNIDPVVGGILVKDKPGGDTQPAACRDPLGGSMFVFWPTDRFGSGTPGTPGQPWFLGSAMLGWNNGFVPWGEQWWSLENRSKLPAFEWPEQGIPGELVPESIKYTAPTVALHPSQYNPNLNPYDAATNKDGRDPVSVLFWQGQADFRDSRGLLSREFRIFYTEATGGEVQGTATHVFSFPRDLTMPKFGPRPLITDFGGTDHKDHQLWCLSYGGDAGRWNLFATVSRLGDALGPARSWSQDVRLLTPSALVSAAEPMAVGRHLPARDDPDGKPALDVIYTGISKYLQNSDILMTRYVWNGRIGGLDLRAQRMPRVVADVSEYRSPTESSDPADRLRGEILQRDPKRNVYVARHMGWVKHPGTPFDEQVGGTKRSSGLWLDPTLNGQPVNYPFVKVLIPTTDSSSGKVNYMVLYATHNVAAEVDRTTGVYRFTYPEGSPEREILGEMFLDHSAGIVRFTNLLPPKALVVAQYTPQTLRLTTGTETDNMPYVILQKSRMNGLYDVGFGGPDNQVPVDRLWVFWRKPDTSGLRASTIYYKTYRLALDPPLTDVPPIAMKEEGGKIRAKDLGPQAIFERCQVATNGREIYFTEANEIFDAMSDRPNGFELSYEAADGKRITIPVDGVVRPYELNVDGETIRTVTRRIVWKEELQETALLSYAADAMVNESQVCAFVDPLPGPPNNPLDGPTKVWVFWSSTREGTTDLFYEAISPSFGAQ